MTVLSSLPSFKIMALLFGVAAVAALLTAQSAEAADTPAPSPLQGYDSQNLRWLEYNHPSLYSQIEAFPWVSDGLSSLERDFIDEILYVGAEDITSLETALELAWVQDAVTEVEYDVVLWLVRIGISDALVMRALISMPFLKSPDATDVLALRSIHRLARREALSPLKEHAAFLDGISETETTLVAAAGTLYRDTYEISRLLTPGYASIEEAASAAGVQISIIRTDSQPQTWTAGALADAVEFAEQTMLLDLPVDHVILVLNDKAVISTADGANYGFAMSLLPKYEQSQDTFEGRYLQRALVHEVAHYYWLGNEGWIDEGLANTIEYMHGIDNDLSPGQLRTPRKNCEVYDLQMLSEWAPETSDPRYYCNYYLGTPLFLELRESMTEAEFSQKLRDLYNLSLTEQESDRTPGIATIRQVFIDQASIVDKHWSGALHAPENRPFDEGVSRISHDLVQWERYPNYDEETEEVSFSGTLLADAVLSSETIQQARQGRYANFSLSIADVHGGLGVILPPLDHGNWILDPEDAVATTYQLDEGTFTVKFPFPTALSSPSDYVVIAWGFRDERRTPSIGDNIDVLGYARIRMASDVTTGSAVSDQYDANHNGVIEFDEAFQAVRNHFAGNLSLDDAFAVVRLYYAGLS